MNSIMKQIKLETSTKQAFDKFINKINDWWPKEYTWSQDKLIQIKIESKENGLCTEIGPHDFRCDWGRVVKLISNKKIELKWQISPKREPIPDPGKASDIEIEFTENGGISTMTFRHKNFENHGDGADKYREMMDSPQGWDYILNNYKRYCEAQED